LVFQFTKKCYQLETEQYISGKNTFDFQNSNDFTYLITDFLNRKQKKVWQSVVQEDTGISL